MGIEPGDQVSGLEYNTKEYKQRTYRSAIAAYIFYDCFPISKQVVAPTIMISSLQGKKARLGFDPGAHPSRNRPKRLCQLGSLVSDGILNI